MIGKLLLWVRRNTRKAIALAIAPGLLFLAVDAAIGHIVNEFEHVPQYVPVVYGLAAALFIGFAALPKSRGVFAVVMRVLGAAGVVTGVWGTALHLIAAYEELAGDFSLANLQGTLPTAPPVFAPLAFAGIGALLFMLPSKMLLLRLKIGKPAGAKSGDGTDADVVKLKSVG